MMKSLLFSMVLLGTLSTTLAQVTIASPYEFGQVKININITYEPSLKTADSVVLEVNYGDAYQKVSTAKGLPKQLSQSYRSKERFMNNRKFRVVVYQKAKEPLYSNEVDVYYKPQFSYIDGGLPSVTDIKATLLKKGDATYVHLTWKPVPGVFAYRLFTESAGAMIWEASLGDDGFIYDTSFDYLVEYTGESTFTFGIGALDGPNSNSDVPKLVNKCKITVPAR